MAVVSSDRNYQVSVTTTDDDQQLFSPGDHSAGDGEVTLYNTDSTNSVFLYTDPGMAGAPATVGLPVPADSSYTYRTMHLPVYAIATGGTCAVTVSVEPSQY
jgi:hypothetical protein